MTMYQEIKAAKSPMRMIMKANELNQQEFFVAEPGTEHVLLLPYELLRPAG